MKFRLNSSFQNFGSVSYSSAGGIITGVGQDHGLGRDRLCLVE